MQTTAIQRRPMTGYFCTLCFRPMKRNRWGWFDHLRETNCSGQHAEWIEVED